MRIHREDDHALPWWAVPSMLVAGCLGVFGGILLQLARGA